MHLAYTLFLSALLAVILTGCDKSTNEAVSVNKGPASVVLSGSAVMVAKMRRIYPEFKLPAIVEAVQSAKIKPKISAALTANHFSAGDMVEQGQLLVELNAAELKAALNSSAAELQSVKASVLQAEANWTRAKELMPKGYISARDYDMTKADVETARAAVSRAEAKLDSAQLKLSHTKIIAPFSGRIGKPGHAVGDQVSPLSITPLFELAQLDPIYITASVELGVYNKFLMLRKNLESQGRNIPELEVSIELKGTGAYPHAGNFQAWDHTAGNSRGMIAGRALFPNPDGMLLPGETVIAHGRAIEPIDRIFIPQMTVQRDQQGSFVFVIDDEGLTHRKDIELGIRDAANWAVRSGLADGDRVIIEGAQRLAPGMQVQIGNSL